MSDGATGPWQEVDPDTHSVPAKANYLIFRAGIEMGVVRKGGFRHGDYTDDWNRNVVTQTLLQAGTVILADNVWDRGFAAGLGLNKIPRLRCLRWRNDNHGALRRFRDWRGRR